MTLVTGTVQDLGYDGMEGTLWARPARFRSDGQVVYAPERKSYKVVDGAVSADLAPGPAILELQVGSHARGKFEVVIPEADTTLAALLDTVFPWEPAQISLFVAEREAAEQAASDAETAAADAEVAAQQTGQDRTAVATDKDTVVSHVQALAEPNDAAVLGLISEGADTATKAALNATYVPQAELPNLATKSEVATLVPRDEWTPTLGTAWVPLGDSLTSIGAGAPQGAGWVEYVAHRTAGRFYLLKNAGVSGNNTTQMLARLQADVLDFSPKIVTFLGGTNDITNGVPFSTYQANVTQMVDRVTAIGAAVVILSIPPRDLADQKLETTSRWNAWLREFARSRNLHFVDIHSRMVNPVTGGYRAGLGNEDGLHFSREGAALIGDVVIEQLSPFMPHGGVLRPTSNVDPNNLAANGLMLDGPDSTPTDFLYTAAPAGVTMGRVDDPSFVGGKAWQVSAPNLAEATPSFSFYKSITSGYSPGDQLLMSVRFSISDTTVFGDAEKFGLSVFGLFYDAPAGQTMQYFARTLSLDGHHGVAYGVVTVPEGTTNVQLSANWSLPAGSSGVYRVGEYGIYNMTTMGALASDE